MKDVFFLRRASKMGTAKFDPLKTELLKWRTVEEETNADLWMVPKTWRNLNALRYYICHEIDMFKQLAANLNIWKISLVSYCVGQIC
jgi:hypothetical protein